MLPVASNSVWNGQKAKTTGNEVHRSSQPILQVMLSSQIASIRSPASGLDVASSMIGSARRKYGIAVMNQTAFTMVLSCWASGSGGT